MTDAENPPPQFPNYSPPVKEGPHIADAKQAKPLMKIINRMLRPRPRQRVSRMKKSVAKRKHEEYGWI